MANPFRATLRVGGGPRPGSHELAGDARAQEPMLERLALPRAVHEIHGTRCPIAFDEFQDALTAGPRIDAVIRSEIERHAVAASYVFAATGKEVGDALSPLLEFAARHPQRAMLLAHFLWEETPRRGSATAETFVRTRERVIGIEAAEELQALWAGLAAGERRAMLAIAAGRPPFARSTPFAVGGSRGGGMDHAIGALLDKGDLAEEPASPTGYRVVDPLLERWIRSGRRA